MDFIVETLPAELGVYITVINTQSQKEQNICTIEQVAVASAKVGRYSTRLEVYTQGHNISQHQKVLAFSLPFMRVCRYNAKHRPKRAWCRLWFVLSIWKTSAAFRTKSLNIYNLFFLPLQPLNNKDTPLFLTCLFATINQAILISNV